MPNRLPLPVPPRESARGSDSSPRKLGEIAQQTAGARTVWKDADVEPIDEATRKERLARVIDLAKQAGGKRYMGFKFDAFVTTSAYQQSVKEAVEEWANSLVERMRSREGLVLYGPVGTGKDHLAFAAVARGIVKFGVWAKWRNGRDLAGEIRDRITTNSSERSLIDSLEDPDVLVLSDPVPPIGDLKDHQADMFYRIVENRSAAGKITVVTLNAADDDEADRRLGTPTWDRLRDNAWLIGCFWESHRQPAKVIRPPQG